MTNNKVELALKTELSRLEKIIQGVQKRLQAAPEGCLRSKRHGSGYQYYHRMDTKDPNGVYIPVSEKERARLLAQKKYDQEVLRAATGQYKTISDFLEKYDPDILKEIYGNTHESRKRLLCPVELPDREYKTTWQAFEYPRKGFAEGTAEHYTNRNERVRSKSEVLIANALDKAGLAYRYECPLVLGNQQIHPDFTILRISDRKEIYWEHMGLIDDSEYRNNALARIDLYEKNGIFPGHGLIITAETIKYPLNTVAVKRIVQHYILESMLF